MVPPTQSWTPWYPPCYTTPPASSGSLKTALRTWDSVQRSRYQRRPERLVLRIKNSWRIALFIRTYAVASSTMMLFMSKYSFILGDGRSRDIHGVVDASLTKYMELKFLYNYNYTLTSIISKCLNISIWNLLHRDSATPFLIFFRLFPVTFKKKIPCSWTVEYY